MHKGQWIQFCFAILLIFGAFTGCQSVENPELAAPTAGNDCSTPRLYTQCLRDLEIMPAWEQFDDHLKELLPFERFAQDLVDIYDDIGQYVNYIRTDESISIDGQYALYQVQEQYEAHILVTQIGYDENHKIHDLRFWYVDPEIEPPVREVLSESYAEQDKGDGIAEFATELLLDVVEKLLIPE